jgi:trigger factor
MNIKKDSLDELNAVISLKIEKTDYDERVDKVLKDYRRKARFDGFRPGKVPQGLVNKMYRKAVLIEEINKILGESLSQYLVDEKLNILGEPLAHEEKQMPIDWDHDEEFEFSFDIGLAPSLEISVSDKDTIPYYMIKTDQEEITKQRDRISSRYGSFQPVDEITENEMLKAELTETNEQGEPVEGGVRVEDAAISLEFIKDEAIKNSFKGHKAGDLLVINVRKAFENETDRAALLKVDKEKLPSLSDWFRIVILSVSQYVKPEINQELFDKVYGPGKVNSLEEFDTRIEEELKAAFDRNSQYKFKRDAREYFVNKFTQDLPNEFLKRWLLHSNSDKLTPEQVDKDFDHFMADLKWQLIKGKIVRDQEMEIREEELQAHVMESLRQQFIQYYGIADVPAETLEKYTRESLSREEERNRYSESLMENKVYEFMQKTVKLNTKEVTLEEFNQLFA